MSGDHKSLIDRKSARKESIRQHYDKLAISRSSWIKKNNFFHEEDSAYFSFLIPKGAKVLDLGCGTGQLLASLQPSQGVGVDISECMIDVAGKNFSSNKNSNLNKNKSS